MGDRTKIEWSDATWNPVTGCDKVSPGCDHCYAETIATRFSGTGTDGMGCLMAWGKVNGSPTGGAGHAAWPHP